MEKKLRRSQVSLVTLGAGVILFGLWSVIKSLLYVNIHFAASFPNTTEGCHFCFVLKILTKGRFYNLMFLQLFPTRIHNLKIVIAALIVLFNLAVELFSIYFVVKNGLSGQSYIEYAVSMLVDLSSTVLLIELIVTVLRVRKLSALSEG